MPFILAIDYDDTLFEGGVHKKGPAKMDIINHIKEFKKYGAELALWTCREGTQLEEAIKRCKDEAGLEFDSINSNTPATVKYVNEVIAKEGNILASRKILADFYLDDKALNLEIFLKIKPKETCEQFVNR